MLQKPAEWRRFEPVELEGTVARATSKAMGPIVHESASSMLREYERVLRENERLHVECAELRSHAAKSGNEAVRFQEDLDAARSELGRLQYELENFRGDMRNAASAAVTQEKTAPHMDAPQPNATQTNVAEVVAGYLFPDPNEPQVRLVQDALRSRGIL